MALLNGSLLGALKILVDSQQKKMLTEESHWVISVIWVSIQQQQKNKKIGQGNEYGRALKKSEGQTSHHARIKLLCSCE